MFAVIQILHFRKHWKICRKSKLDVNFTHITNCISRRYKPVHTQQKEIFLSAVKIFGTISNTHFWKGSRDESFTNWEHMKLYRWDNELRYLHIESWEFHYTLWCTLKIKRLKKLTKSLNLGKINNTFHRSKVEYARFFHQFQKMDEGRVEQFNIICLDHVCRKKFPLLCMLKMTNLKLNLFRSEYLLIIFFG